MKLQKSELPSGWKVKGIGKDWVKYSGLRSNVLVHKDGNYYWFDSSIKDAGRIDTTFVKDKNKVKPMLKKIMREDFVLRRV
jgi:hypothetical protein